MSNLATTPASKSFPLTPTDCKTLSALLDHYSVFELGQYPVRALVAQLAEATELDADTIYYSLKHMRMARFV